MLLLKALQRGGRTRAPKRSWQNSTRRGSEPSRRRPGAAARKKAGRDTRPWRGGRVVECTRLESEQHP